jgi:1-acyl-sn-glycerol-3-phosphate acyltransferase
MNERPDRVTQDPWWMFGRALVGGAFHLAIRLKVEGLEHIPPTGPAILAANHVSPLDPIAMGLVASRAGRTVRFLTASESFEIPFVGWGLRRLEQIPIRRGTRDLAAIEDAARVIARGALAGIYPEGGLGPGDRLQPAKRGMARLALAAGAPVVPMGVWGMQVRWPAGGPKLRPPLRPPAAVVTGPAVATRGDPANEDDVRMLTETVMAEIARLVDRARAVTSQSAAGRSQ